jgi:hypothetical protein
MNLTAQNPHMPAMPRSNIHLDILEGRDETLDVADFFSELLSCDTYCIGTLSACTFRL